MLIKCPECKLQVSDNALSCPHCGFPLVRPQNSPQKRQKAHMRLPNGFGQISLIKNKRLRKPYRARVTVGKTPEGRPVCRMLKPEAYFATYNEAYAALVEYNRNPYDLDQFISMNELYEKWSSQYFEKISDSSKRTVTSAWKYCSAIYDLPATELRSRHVKLCMDAATSPNIKARIKSVFNLMMDYAVEYEIVQKNYARDFNISEDVLKATDSAKKEHMSFTDDEMRELWKNINDRIVRIILFQCYTGFRPQELGLLKKSDVNITDWTVIGGMKTEAGTNRTVPIHRKIRKIVEISLKESDSEYLFAWPDGTKMTYDKYRHAFDKTMANINLSTEHRPHDPRKQFITMAKNSGMDEYAIKKIAGHSISDITEKIYTDRNINWLSVEIEKIP